MNKIPVRIICALPKFQLQQLVKILIGEHKYHYKASLHNKDDGIHLGRITMSYFSLNAILRAAGP